MFLRKLFKVSDKIKWLILELMVVFIGVYLAFLFQTYNEQVKDKREMEKVFSSLKYELESFRILLPGYASFARNQARDWRKLHREGKYDDYSLWRFLQPQYNYQIIEYAISLENTNIIDFELYDNLQDIYSSIQRLESAEELMTAMAQKYVAIPEGIDKNNQVYKTRYADNLLNFQRFILFMSDRAGNLFRIAKEAEACLKIINEVMDTEILKEIETQLMEDYIKTNEKDSGIVDDLMEYFPNFSEAEIRSLIE